MTLRYLPNAGRLYGPEFARDPQAVYASLRRLHGAVAPVEIASGIEAHLVLDYQAAVDVLTNAGDMWVKDPRPWQVRLPGTPEAAAVLVQMGYRDNCMFTDGAEHTRHRKVINDCYGMIQPHRLRNLVIEVADSLIREFSAAGEADLVAEFTQPIPLRAFNQVLGRPDADSAAVLAALSDMMRADAESSARGNEAFGRYVGELIQSKYARRGDDLTSWIIDHPTGLKPEEVLQHVIVTLGAANEPLTNLISNAISRMVSDDRYYNSLSNGALGTYDALLEVLRSEPAVANYGPYFVRSPMEFHGTWIQPAELVVVSYAAATTAPTGLPDELRSDGGSHLGFSAGAHRCPAADPAMLIAMTAIERLTMHLSDLELTVPREELQWQSGPFHRALIHLPVRFTPIRLDQPRESPWSTQSSSSWTPSDPTSPAKPPGYATSAPWSS
jgi:cytochrome P450